MRDLKILNDLLLEFMESKGLKPDDLLTHSEATRVALERLHRGWSTGVINWPGNLSIRFGEYFEEMTPNT